MLSEQGAGWYFKRNLGRGKFGPARAIERKPSMARLNGAGQQLLDVGGEGRLDLVDLAPGAGGFYERAHDPADPDGLLAGWGRYRPFKSFPVLDWEDPNLRFVDLTGDGIADILITEDVAFRCYPSLGREGFGPAVRIPAPCDEDEGPRIVFSDPTQSIYLADMSGDGLTESSAYAMERCATGQSRLRAVWPKIAMDRSPWFDEPGLFDRPQNSARRYRRLRNDRHSLCRPPRSESFSTESATRSRVRGSSAVFLRAGQDSVSVVRFPWDAARPACSGPPRCAQLTASAPLRRSDARPEAVPPDADANNLGAETTIDYASSTEFYLG